MAPATETFDGFPIERINIQIPAVPNEILSLCLVPAFLGRGLENKVQLFHCEHKIQFPMSGKEFLDPSFLRQYLRVTRVPKGTMVGATLFPLLGRQYVVNVLKIIGPNGETKFYFQYASAECRCKNPLKIADLREWQQLQNDAIEQIEDPGAPLILPPSVFRFDSVSWEPQTKNSKGRWKCNFSPAETVRKPLEGQPGHFKLSDELQARLDQALEKCKDDRAISILPYCSSNPLIRAAQRANGTTRYTHPSSTTVELL